jgi:hypothetical protein
MEPVDPSLLALLAGPEGESLLGAARATRDLAPHRRPAALRGLASPEGVRAALLQDDLRRRAAPRCPHADRLLLLPGALEQATAWEVAAERATRWASPPSVPLVDLTAGQGFDALATALAGRAVTACERDPLRAALLAENARRLGVSHLLQVETLEAEEAPPGPLAFLDPDRREGGRRTRDPETFSPPASRWPHLLARYGRAMVKVGPATDAVGLEVPFEVVSLDRRARERRLLVGFPAAPPRAALALPGGERVEGEGLSWPDPRAPREGDWLLDPDPAVTLAGLVGDLARSHGLSPVHPRIAYLLGDAPRAGAPGTWLEVEAVLPARARAIDSWLASRGIGDLEIRTRGVADPPEAWRRRLRPRGPRRGTLVLTRGPDERWTALGASVGGPDG